MNPDANDRKSLFVLCARLWFGDVSTTIDIEIRKHHLERHNDRTQNTGSFWRSAMTVLRTILTMLNFLFISTLLWFSLSLERKKENIPSFVGFGLMVVVLLMDCVYICFG